MRIGHFESSSNESSNPASKKLFFSFLFFTAFIYQMQTLARFLNDCCNIYLFNLFIVKRPVALFCSYSPFFNKLRKRFEGLEESSLNRNTFSFNLKTRKNDYNRLLKIRHYVIYKHWQRAGTSRRE